MNSKARMGSPLLFSLVIALFCCIILGNTGPFPVKGQIFDENNQAFGTAHVYPRFVEIYDSTNQQVGKVGVLVEEGVAKLFLVGHDSNRTLVGWATKGQLHNQDGQVVGTYFATPTWSFVYRIDGKRAGKVKCIAWPRVCAVGVAGYLLNLFE